MYQSTLLESNMKELIVNRKEVEIIDLMIRVQEQLDLASRTNQLQNVTKLEDHLAVIIACLPQDLQKSIQKRDDSKQIYTIDDSNSDEESET